jgi:hypothetical protein
MTKGMPRARKGVVKQTLFELGLRYVGTLVTVWSEEMCGPSEICVKRTTWKREGRGVLEGNGWRSEKTLLVLTGFGSTVL